MKRTFIGDIGNNADVKDYFLVVKKAIYSAKNGAKYGSIA